MLRCTNLSVDVIMMMIELSDLICMLHSLGRFFSAINEMLFFLEHASRMTGF